MSDVDLKEAEIDSAPKFDDNEANLQEEIIDPRVQVELERLNTSTDLINKLEIELDVARSNFRLLLNDSSIRINQLAKKLGSCVEKAKPYYEARMRAKQLQTQTQKAAFRYERASSAHSAAKEMVFIAEEGLKTEGRCFDPAWQEMLNHATLRVNEAESERVLSQHEHQKVSSAYNDAEKIVQKLHQDVKKAIVKSSLSSRRSLLQLNNLANQHQLQLLPYFEMKAQFNLLLEEHRKKVHLLEENVLKVKMSYADALHNLEKISDEIHKKRESKDHLVCDQAETRQNNRWNNLEIYNKLSSNISSSEDVYYDDLHSDDVYMNLPSKLKVRSDIVNTTCPGLSTEVALSQADSVAETSDASASDSIECNTIMKGINSNGTLSHDDDCNKYEQKNLSYKTLNSSSISTEMEHLNLSNYNSDGLVENLSNGRDKLSLREEVPDPKYLAPDFNILRVQREEISDSESLASNDTTDTLDDNQIECLLLDKALPLDVDGVLL